LLYQAGAGPHLRFAVGTDEPAARTLAAFDGRASQLPSPKTFLILGLLAVTNEHRVGSVVPSFRKPRKLGQPLSG
jgi:hypothetical protein